MNKYKVGGRVLTDKYGKGTVTNAVTSIDGQPAYLIEVDNGGHTFLIEERVTLIRRRRLQPYRYGFIFLREDDTAAPMDVYVSTAEHDPYSHNDSNPHAHTYRFPATYEEA